MKEIKFYKGTEDTVCSLAKLFDHVDTIRSLKLDAELLSRVGDEELVVYLPPATINAVKNAVHRIDKGRNRESASPLMDCAHSPRRPEPPPPRPRPDPPCKPGKAC